MNYITKYYCFFVAIILLGCSNDDDVTIDDIISSIEYSKTELIANGSDITTIKVFFKNDINLELIKLNVEVNNGIFVESQTNTVEELTPEIDIAENIFVEINLKSSTVNLDHNLTFKVERYEKEESISSVISLPSTINLETDSFSVLNNFGSEINLEATVLNENGLKVSNGVKVIFTDLFADGLNVNGSFQNMSTSTNANSKVTTRYSPGLIEADQFITLKAEVLNPDETLSGIIDTIQIFVNNND